MKYVILFRYPGLDSWYVYNRYNIDCLEALNLQVAEMTRFVEENLIAEFKVFVAMD